MNANDIRLVLLPSPRTVLHWFDFICPFCYLGQQRNQILSRHGLEIVHLPFQIHPDIPPEGVEAGPRDGPMYQALEREAAQTGLSLNWPPRLPGTRTALERRSGFAGAGPMRRTSSTAPCSPRTSSSVKTSATPR